MGSYVSMSTHRAIAAAAPRNSADADVYASTEMCTGQRFLERGHGTWILDVFSACLSMLAVRMQQASFEPHPSSCSVVT